MARARPLLAGAICLALIALAFLIARPRQEPSESTGESRPEEAAPTEEFESGSTRPANRSLPPEAQREGNRKALDSSARRLLGGRVGALDGRPLEGADVRWLALEEEDTRPVPGWPDADWGQTKRAFVETRTSEEGRFFFAEPPAAELPFSSVLVVLHDAHAPGGLDLGSDPGQWPKDAQIVLDPAEPILVEVLGDKGDPQAGATVQHLGKAGAASPGSEPERLYERFLTEEKLTDAAGQARLISFRGEQVIWARLGDQASRPWQGPRTSRVVLRLGETFSIGGTVLLPDPEPLGERRILVWGSTGGVWRPLAHIRKVGAGSWGPIHIPLADISRYRLRFEGAPFVPIEEEFDRPPVFQQRRLDFQPGSQAELTLIVRDESKKPLPSARAVVWWGETDMPSTGKRVEAAADSEGVIHVQTVPPGVVQYRVTAPGCALFEHEAIPPVAEPIVITLARGGSISGHCLHDGEPVPDFRVTFWKEGSVIHIRDRSFFGRVEGAFEIDGLPPGDWWIQAADDTHPSGRPEIVRVTKDATAVVELDLPTALPGGGRVLSAESGDPLSGARVQVYSSGGMERSLAWGAPLTTSQDGTFETEAFVPGTNFITVSADGYGESQVTEEAGREDFVDFGDIRLHRTQTLSIALLGVAEMEDFGPADLWVYAEDPDLPGRSFSPDGKIAYENVSPGEYQVLLAYPESTGWTRLHLRLDPGEDWTFDHKMGGDRRLDVHATEADGRPLSYSGAMLVIAQEETGTFVVRFSQAPNGRASFHGIRAQEVQVWLFGPGPEVKVVAQRDVSFGPNSRLSIEIAPDQEPFRVHVVDAEGTSLPGAWVTIRSANGAEIHCLDDTDADGWASLFGAPEGAALMDVSHGIEGRRFGVPIDASAKELEFVLEATGSLSLRLRDGDEPLAGVATRIETSGGVVLSHVESSDAGGVARFEPIGEGAYHLSARRGDCWPSFIDLRVEPEEEVSRDLQMRRLGDLELTVLVEGQPTVGIAVDLASLEFDASVGEWLRQERVRSSTGLTTDSGGRIRVEGLPHGAYRWSLAAGEERPTGTLELRPGPANAITLALPL